MPKNRNSKELTLPELHRLLDYNRETGVFTWRVNRAGRARAGSVAGSIDSSGYRQIEVFQKAYLSARLAWFYVTGEWPKEQIDHCDVDPLNDRFDNLREATRSENIVNRPKRAAQGGGKPKSQYIGVCARPSGRWAVAICKDHKRKNLGTFLNEEDAAREYDRHAVVLFGKFAHLNFNAEA